MSKAAWDHLYSPYRWRQRRLRHLRQTPLCVWCQKRGRVAVATIAHHVVPHKGDTQLFWYGELESLCQPCHDIDAQRIERGSKPRRTMGVDGWPIEPK